MLKNYTLFILFNMLCLYLTAQIKILDSISNLPVSYATVSFGNGQGIFADDEGRFIFNKKLYPDVDTLFISALGYKDLTKPINSLKSDLLLVPSVDELEEVVLNYAPNRSFKIEILSPHLDDDYYKCWLPTIESEIAVFVPNSNGKRGRIDTVQFPMALESKDWEKRNKRNSEKKPFSTLFRVKFYKNIGGFPGEVLTYQTIVFRATEANGTFYELDVSDNAIPYPAEGLFVSLQVLGYTDTEGKLLPNKKYKEIKTPQGIVKIPTNFRPLLPFTDKITTHNTYIRRVFINKNEWTLFKEGNGFISSLLDKGLYNYGIGLTLKIYTDE